MEYPFAYRYITDLGHTKEAHIQRTSAPLPQAPAELLFLPRWAL